MRRTLADRLPLALIGALLIMCKLTVSTSSPQANPVRSGGFDIVAVRLTSQSLCSIVKLLIFITKLVKSGILGFVGGFFDHFMVG